MTPKAVAALTILWGRNDVRTHITGALVWAHDTVRPGKWHRIVGPQRREPLGAGYERPTACGRAVVDSYGYEEQPGRHRWLTDAGHPGLPPVGLSRTEGVCARCLRSISLAVRPA